MPAKCKKVAAKRAGKKSVAKKGKKKTAAKKAPPKKNGKKKTAAKTAPPQKKCKTKPKAVKKQDIAHDYYLHYYIEKNRMTGESPRTPEQKNHSVLGPFSSKTEAFKSAKEKLFKATGHRHHLRSFCGLEPELYLARAGGENVVHRCDLEIVKKGMVALQRSPPQPSRVDKRFEYYLHFHAERKKIALDHEMLGPFDSKRIACDAAQQRIWDVCPGQYYPIDYFCNPPDHGCLFHVFDEECSDDQYQIDIERVDRGTVPSKRGPPADSVPASDPPKKVVYKFWIHYYTEFFKWGRGGFENAKILGPFETSRLAVAAAEKAIEKGCGRRDLMSAPDDELEDMIEVDERDDPPFESENKRLLVVRDGYTTLYTDIQRVQEGKPATFGAGFDASDDDFEL